MQQAAVPDPLIGHTIGNYEVKAKLGEGGMGAVYLAEHPLIGKKVALKVLHSEFTSNDDIATRFFHEAKAVNDIQHPNIVDIVDYGVLPGEGKRTVYFIMEFLDGMSLADLIRTQAPLPPERALAIALQIADALSASHQGEIVHRDLKPDNVMLIQRGRQQDFVKVLDFGIAKLTGDPTVSRRTRTGIVMGTPAYMSPEQCEGKGNVDHRTDIYALGILLYEMLTGQVPFQGEGFGEVLVQHLTRQPARPSLIAPVIPAHVEAVVMKALEKSPAARYQSMTEFMHALADPVSFVERSGGLSGFLGNMGAPMSGIYNQATPPPGAIPTPMPGQISGMYTPAPGTLQVATGATQTQPGQSKGGARLGIVAIAATAVVGLAVAGYLVLGGMSGDGGDTPMAATTPELEDEPSTVEDTPEPLEPAAVVGVDAPGEDEVGEDEIVPAAPELVTVQVATDPAGAEVYVNDEEEPRGHTPLSFTMEKSADSALVTLRRSRYRVETRTFSLDKNQTFDLKLSREARDSGHRVKRSTVKTDRKDPKQSKDPKDKKPDKIDRDVGLMNPSWD